jgi:putative membrane-bound dehydrogenase-like protein
MMSIRRIFDTFVLVIIGVSTALGADKYTLHSFEKTKLTDLFFGEGANFGDFNHDGVMDLVSGPYWFAGPKFTERHEYYDAAPFDINGYSKNFLAFTHDVNGDDWTDIVIVGFPGEESWWFANPQGKNKRWDRHVIFPVVDNESPAFTDVTGDGQPELVCSTAGQLGYAEMPDGDRTQLWKFTPVSPKRDYQRFTHGLGVGDVNNDGRQDILVKEGWWEQPAPDEKTEFWTLHEVPFSAGGGAQMLVYDVDGDGDNDVVTSKAAHAWGLSWFEKRKRVRVNVSVGVVDGVKVGPVETGGDESLFREHVILPEKNEPNEYGVAFTQLHALALADMDQDGVQDIITGKRFWAHNGHDPGEREPAVLYWFQTVRDNSDQKVHFVPHRIDADSGVGTQVTVGNINGDKWPDIVVGNKKGTFVFLHKAEDTDQKTWEAAQPKRTDGVEPNAAAEAQPPAKPQATANPRDDDGFLATAADGRTLNLDFERGDLTDWTADGTAFKGQPIEGDTVHLRRPDSVSGHRGKFWLGTYEPEDRDGPQGKLTSVPFKVTHPYASFLVGGGAGAALRVDIVRADNNEVVFTASGRNKEQMRLAVADLQAHVGKDVFLRISDLGSAGWGHVNYDHFRFHDEKPAAASKPAALHADSYPYAGLPAKDAARVMKVPHGFEVTVSAAEPDVKQPIAMAYDDRGRLWVAEAYEYPVRAPEGKGRDRILIFQDIDGDGSFDKRKVFMEKLNLVSGLEVGFGGVWVGAAPYLMFIPDRNGDDVPDGEPEILLDGWAMEDTHETLNTFIWGPDGWLYGCHGVFTHSRVGKPGAPERERIPLNAAIWRYHPTRHKFEVFAEGTSNPWGVDFDDNGQAFATACVIPHLYHIIQGARYQRQAGAHFNPHTYADIQTIADHRHYVGDNPHGGNGKSDDAGGGHAHSGAMIYLGGRWPKEYRGRIFMNNIHGQRLNTDVLVHEGSGFVGKHGQDFLLTGDIASQILNIRYGPDGNAFFIDWYDTNACHHNNVEGHDRSNGRIYKVSYGEAKAKPVNVQQRSDKELVMMLAATNDWFVRHARRVLQERAAAGKLGDEARSQLATMAEKHFQASRRLRAMWALHVTGGLPDDLIAKLLRDKDEYVRAWTIQLALDRENPNLDSLLPQFSALAKSDPSPVVRLYLASAMQRVSPEQRWDIMEGLVSRSGDASDHNLPLMYWYAAEPLAEADPQRALAFALACGDTMPLVREFMVRRIAGLDSAGGLAVLVRALGKSSSDAERLVILKSVRSALTGQRQVNAPAEWASVYGKLAGSERAELQAEATALGVTFGDPTAFESLRKVVQSRDADASARREALQALLAAKDAGLAATLQLLLEEPTLRDAALHGLALYDDPQTPSKLLAVYADLSPNERRGALSTLASRAPYAVALLKAVGEKQIAANELPADLVRQLHNLKDDAVDEMLSEIWGTVRSTAEDKAQLIAHYRELISKPPAKKPDVTLGRAVFAKTCQQCHMLYGVGATIGPDLTGSNRSDLEYLLTNVVDPGALIAKEYRSTLLVTVDGRVITGIVTSDDGKAVTVRTATETIVLPRDEIEESELTETSMMPDDQLKQFSEHEILSLVAYLRGKSQVPMRATKENAGLFFNGRDLTGWTGDPNLWSVENGEIIGRSSGLEHNSFLISDLAAGNFKLSLEVKLKDNAGNSGIQFRSKPLNGYNEVFGYQADIGPDWWGKLYEENGRALLWDKPGEQHVKNGDWNRYEIEAAGSRIRTWINGQPCVDLDDPDGRRRGIFALQLHSGGPTEVRFRNLQLEVKE